MEQFGNNFQTQLNGAIDDNDTTLTVDAVPTDMNGNFRILIDSEIILVGAISGLTFTGCIRGLEGTSAASHNDNSLVTHIITATSLRSVGGFLYSSKPVADTPDDNFTSTSLDGKWTVISGTATTVDYLESGNVEKYDLSTRRGSMLIQVGTAATQEVILRQDYTLPDGNSIIAAFSPSFHVGASTADELQIGISLNGDDTNYNAGANYLAFYGAEIDASGPEIQTLVTGSSGGEASITLPTTTWGSSPGRTIFLRIARSGLWYYPSYSWDGITWIQFGGTSYASAHTNLWFFCRNAASTGVPVPIHTLHWIRLGTNGQDPWTWASR